MGMAVLSVSVGNKAVIYFNRFPRSRCVYGALDGRSRLVSSNTSNECAEYLLML